MPVTGPMNPNNQYENESFPSNSIQAVIETPMYAVKYTDGYGKTKMRLVIMVDDKPYFLPPEVSSKAKSTQRWFEEAVRDHLGLNTVKKTKKSPAKAKKSKAAEKSGSVPQLNLDSI
jgi:hypothetical protein